MNCPHCETNIDEHEATRCLDAWVAEQVMGWKPYKIISVNILYPPSRIATNDEYPFRYKPFDPECEYDFDSSHFFDSREGGFTQPIVPKYSTEIEIAWPILGRLREQDWEYSVSHNHVMLCHKEWITDSVAQSRPVIEAKADVPLAICRAAIKAKGKEDEKEDE